MKRSGFITVTTALLLCPAPAIAQQTPPANVEITVNGSIEALDHITTDLREHLTPLGVEHRVYLVQAVDPSEVITPQPDAPPALLRVWIGQGPSADEVTLFLVDSRWEQVERRIVAVDQVGATLAETISSRRRETEPVETEPVETEPAPEPSDSADPAPEPAEDEAAGEEGGEGEEAEPQEEPPRPRSFIFAIGYGVNLWSGETTPLHGAEAWISLVFNRVRFSPDLRLAFGFRLNGSLPGEGVRLDYGSTEIRLLTSLEVFRTELLRLRVGAGAGIDLLTVEPVVPAAEGTEEESLADRQTVVLPTIRAMAELTVRVSTTISISVGAAADFGFIDLTLAVGEAEQRSLLFEPFLVRPVFYGALTWRLR